MLATTSKAGVALLALGCATTLAVSGVTVAQATGKSSTVKACEAKKTHDLHLGKCKKGEHKVTWSARGPKGSKGAPGPSTVVWQVVVNANGTIQYAHAGVKVTHPSTGNYTVSWKKFPGQALPYCFALGSNPALASGAINSTDGTGHIDISLNGADSIFWCQLDEEPASPK